MKPAIFVLTCASKPEAKKVAKALLEKKLIACAKLWPIEADFWWEGKIDHTKETLLLMDSSLDQFPAVEKVVNQLHSYEAPVLEALELSKISNKARHWLQDSLK